ncbi:MAG: hypothetical protein ACU0DK_17585 [Pseudooceanicola sp.]
MSTFVSSVAPSALTLVHQPPAFAVSTASDPITVTAHRPYLVTGSSAPLPSGTDPMSIFDSLLVDMDITGPQLLRTSRYASRLYLEMQKLLMRLS